MNMINIIVGVFTAGFLIFLRNANLNAQKQKVAAVRLRSYLNYWKNIIIDNDYFNIFYIGVKWNEEVQEILANGGSAEDLVSLENDKKKLIDDLKVAIESESKDFVLNEDEIIKKINKIPDKFIDNLLDYATRSEQNLIDGKTFINDDDASLFSPATAQVCVSLKLRLSSMMFCFCTLIIRIASDKDKFRIKDYAKEISDLLWLAIRVSKDIDILSSRIEAYTNKSVFALTMDNISLGS